eukprot:TRINITY_DN60945_c0_g1_i2.p1 TRINITY_DN60945_c0_g1~~TRINITY_DN60945_c0_g1_i2.p1  ORF type:complete len:199 (+),score=43.19 TRINITY_DN60945_c0_g1_i2:119-715(+)
MLRSLVGSEMCIRDRYQRRVRGKGLGCMMGERNLDKVVSIALSAQFVLAMINTLHRSDITPVLCLIGFYSVKERKQNATRTYLIFLFVSIVLDVIWLSAQGSYIYSYLRTHQFADGQLRDNHLLEFVFMCSVVLLVVKMLSAIAVYKFYVELEEGFHFTSTRSGFGSIGTDLESASTEQSSLIQATSNNPTSAGYQNE